MKFNKFEEARIIGARALQISMGAPLLVKRPKDMYNPILIAELEYEKNALPITVQRVKEQNNEENAS